MRWPKFGEMTAEKCPLQINNAKNPSHIKRENNGRIQKQLKPPEKDEFTRFFIFLIALLLANGQEEIKLRNEQFQPQNVTTWSDELKWLFCYLICILSGFIKAPFLSHASKKEKNESHPWSEHKWWLSIHLWMCSRIINVGSCDCMKRLRTPALAFLNNPETQSFHWTFQPPAN